jgi:apolipoprotein N-acyltransferase
MQTSFFLGCLAFLLVAFGQPGWIPFLAPFAAAFGYALFWRAYLIFPSRRKRFWVASSFFGFAQLVQLSWMTSYRFQGFYILFVYAALAFCLGLQFGLLSLMIPTNRGMSFLRIAALASLWTIFEWMRYFFLCGLSFNPTGLALTASSYSLQFAAIWGVLGLSFWVMLTNGFAFNCFFSKRLSSSLAIWGCAACIPYLFGIAHLSWHQPKQEKAARLHCALIQTGLLPSQKVPLRDRFDEFIPPLVQWRRVVQVLRGNVREKIALIALPEAAFPLLADQPFYPLGAALTMLREELGEKIDNCLPPMEAPYASVQINDQEKSVFVSNAFFGQFLANYFDADCIVGLDAKDHATNNNYSAAYHFVANQNSINRYEKRVLLPLAESLPYEWCRTLAKRYGITEFFESGKEAKVFQGAVPLSISICYEETYGSIMRESKKKGAHLFVNVTNDNWYPDSRLPKQHFDLARIRTVESGAPLVRSCNSGITAALDSLGGVVAKLGKASDRSQWEYGILMTSVPIYHYRTPYLVWGNSGILVLSFSLIVLFLVKQRFWRNVFFSNYPFY